MKATILLAVAFLLLPAAGHVQPPPHYDLLAISPAKFPVLPIGSPWTPLRALKQTGAIVYVSPGALPPNAVRFRDRHGLDYVLPGTPTRLSGDTWQLVTPSALMPNVLKGPCAVSVLRMASGLESNAKAAGLP